MMKHIAAAMVVLALAGPGIARAEEDCHVSMDRWQPREAAEAMAKARGWTVSRIKIDDGCYEIRGTDETGRAFKAKIAPATLEIVRFRHRDRDADRHGSRREQPSTTEKSAAGGMSSNGLFETNTPPKAVVN